MTYIKVHQREGFKDMKPQVWMGTIYGFVLASMFRKGYALYDGQVFFRKKG